MANHLSKSAKKSTSQQNQNITVPSAPEERDRNEWKEPIHVVSMGRD